MPRRVRVGSLGCLVGYGWGHRDASPGTGGAIGMPRRVRVGSLGWLVGCCGSGRLAPQMSTTGGADSEHPTEAGSIDPRVATVCWTRRLSSVGRAIHS